jgi:general secretion pathway protein D
MKPTNDPRRKSRLAAVPACLMILLLLYGVPAAAPAQPMPMQIIGGNGPISMPGGMPSGSGGSSSSSDKGGGPWIPSEPLNVSTNGSSTNDIQLSFQGANIDMVVQWLAQTTGKTVVKHPQVQCQLTITSFKKVSQREAINIVYRALALEGYTVIESSQSILIVPEGKEPRMSPELISNLQTNIPEGRQRLTKVFALNHVQASQIMEKIRIALTDKASIDLDDRANQLIITDFNDNIRVVGELITALDSGKPEDVAIRVIPLKHISGQDLAKELAPLYQKMNPQGSKDAIDVAADDRSNALIVFSSQASFDALEKVIMLLDTEDAQEKVTETFLLKNADAQDVAKQLQDLAQNQSAVTSRYVYYLSGSSDSGGNTKKLSVVADRRRNAVIVQAPPAQMEGLRKMVAELDEPVDDDSLAPKIYHLKYVSATDVEDVLNELFLKKQTQRSYYDYIFGDDSDNSTPDTDVGRLYGKVRITSEPYSNTLIVTSNSKENLAVVEEIINQLDAPSEAGESTLRIGLKNAKATDVAKNLNILFAKNGSPPLRPEAQQNQPNNSQYPQQQQQQQPQNTGTQTGFDLTQETKEEGYYPWLGGQPDAVRGGDSRTTTRPVSDLVGRVRTVADERINALLISANVHYFPQVLKLVEEMDAASDQVVIQARIVQVSSDFLDQLGVRWSPSGTQTYTADDYDNSILATATTEYMKGYGGTSLVNTPFPSTSTMAQALTSLRSGVLSSSVSMDFLVQFLQRTTDATIIGEPMITIKDNETGKLFVGQEVPRPDNNQVSSLGTQSSTVAYQEAGVTLEVTPHINSSGDVQLRIHVESSSLVPDQTILNAPVFNTDQFRTDLTAKEGQTLVLGGIIQKQISNTLRKTPLLGSIPGLKWLVNNKNKSTQEVELMVFLHPKVIHTPEDAADELQDAGRRAPLTKKWQEDAPPATIK